MRLFLPWNYQPSFRCSNNHPILRYNILHFIPLRIWHNWANPPNNSWMMNPYRSPSIPRIPILFYDTYQMRWYDLDHNGDMACFLIGTLLFPYDNSTCARNRNRLFPVGADWRKPLSIRPAHFLFPPLSVRQVRKSFSFKTRGDRGRQG
jgi:hypothetical protein